MSSRLVSGDAPEVQPIDWAAVPEGRPATRSNAPRQGQTGGEAGSVEQRLRELEADAARRADEAYRRGFQEAESAARAQAAKQWESALERLARTVAEVAGLRGQFRRESEEDAVRLALAVARRILHRELTLNPEAILGLVKAALERLEARELYRIRLHPEAAAIVSRKLGDLGLPVRVEVVADPAFEMSAAVFETTRGTLEASVETQLEEIGRGFADLLGHPS